MTLAGTRPILQDELQKYELHHRARIAIKPGITGMWQVKDRDKVGDIIKENFTLLEEPKIFPKKKETPNYNKRFSGYWARHYRVQLKDNLLQDTQKRYVNSKTEIQVASVLMHAWSEVEHDLVYKPLNGTLSEEELAILDELNGLVLAGEIALERLQIAGTARIVKEKLFNNQYDLASYLYDKYEDKLKNKRQQLGNVELLFRLMKRCDVNTSSDLAPYLTPLTFNEDVIVFMRGMFERMYHRSS